MARRLCIDYVDPSIVSSLLSSRLIALNKNPGVRPIDIGNTSRRIIAKPILSIVKPDILETTGSIQLCVGQPAGVEAAVHAARSIYHDNTTDAILLVDTTNAFNSLNRSTALHNIRRLCPSIATVLINTYRHSTNLYLDGSVLQSAEGTTQGDPLAMQMYAIAIIPLINKLRDALKDVSQIWYADDACASGRIDQLLTGGDLLQWKVPSLVIFRIPPNHGSLLNPISSNLHLHHSPTL